MLTLSPVQANETGTNLLNKLNAPQSVAPAVGDSQRTLSPRTFTTSVDGTNESWRATVTEQANQMLALDLMLGKWPQSSGNPQTLWLSYDLDWSGYTRRDKTITYRYTFGSGDTGVSARFRFGCSDRTRKAVSGDCVLLLVYGRKTCSFGINDEMTVGELPTPTGEGTTVTVILRPNNTVRIEVDGLVVLDQQKVRFKQNYITFSASSSGLGPEDAPRQMVFRDVNVEIR